ncbi:NAD(P)/FAD-dependent oxidoreductase [Halobacteriales archaeon SW_7_68_16]|nr:MAG: NAD(P)/FAD-dependent oxidoreductase [Halobacteriales archaeon SW_7_68_16]
MTHAAVIGAYGSAGVAAASRLVEADVDVTMIDDGEPGGGLCILRGCMPSKEVLSAAAHRFQARHDDRLRGLPEVDLDRVVARKDEHTSAFASHRRAAVERLAAADNAEFVHDTARFVDDREIAVDGRRIEPDYVVIATGSTPNYPDLPGMADVDPLDSAAILDATTVPDSLVVMGFGYVGIELVPYLVEAGGVDVTVIEHDARPLDEADPAFGDRLLDLYREQFGVEIVTHARETTVDVTDEGVAVTLEPTDDAPDPGTVPDRVTGDRLATFTGRRPDLDRLNLSATDLVAAPGWVDATMRATDDDRVFVVGDANGREPILHVAKEQGQVAAENVLRSERGEPLTEYHPIHHHVMFAGVGVYPFVRVGHSERSAREAGLDYHAVTREADDDGVFETKDVPEGLATLVVGADGTVLGYQGLHYHADVMAKTMQIAVELELSVDEIPDRAYHPTTPEIIDGLLRDAAAALD